MLGVEASDTGTPTHHTVPVPPLDPPPVLTPHTTGGVRYRHDHRLEATSTTWHLIVRLRGLKPDGAGARRLVSATSEALGVPSPRLGLHAGRRPDTGHTRPPTRVLAALGHHTADPRRYPPDGHLQLSTTPTLGVIAHELAHHVVFHRDPPSTPAHGLGWVGRFDETALAVALLCRVHPR